MHDLLFEKQPHLKLSQLRGYAERLDLDLLRYAAEMEDQVYLQRIREHTQSGHESGVRATPTFFVDRCEADNHTAGRVRERYTNHARDDVTFETDGLSSRVKARSGRVRIA
jgi:hypothetical protein